MLLRLRVLANVLGRVLYFQVLGIRKAVVEGVFLLVGEASGRVGQSEGGNCDVRAKHQPLLPHVDVLIAIDL